MSHHPTSLLGHHNHQHQLKMKYNNWGQRRFYFPQRNSDGENFLPPEKGANSYFSRRVGENITSNFSTTNSYNIGDC